MDSAKPLKRKLPFIDLYQLRFSPSDASKGKIPEMKQRDKIEYDNQSLGKENPGMSIMKAELLNKTKIIHNDFSYLCGVLRLLIKIMSSLLASDESYQLKENRNSSGIVTWRSHSAELKLWDP